MLEQHPDLVILDIKLPDTDRFLLTRNILELAPSTAVVATSAGSIPDERQRALAAGCVDYIEKPYRFLEMVEYLDRFSNP
ncbi:MAG: response regulator [Aggregatilineales bacterium]